ncbi:hypothetical protein, variant 1 [Batrachochytrium dendrobatidis JEL423]|nr:hypothetical protein, variant 1 [Batrachochytrium dendrobatidis JEL423]
MNTWYARGSRQGPAATKYRKGACENCGAMTHKTKECMDRPRKKGAKWSGQGFQADEVIQQVQLGFEGKRDRWNGYNAMDHIKQVEEWEVIEEKRRLKREKEAQEALAAAAAKTTAAKTNESAASKLDGVAAVHNGDADGFKQPAPRSGLVSAEVAAAAAAAAAAVDDSSDDEDEDKYAEKANVAGQKLDTKSRITVRNLRIREDTAKYLRNLDVNSAHYDPKTRSMRANPHNDKDASEVTYAGDNILRYSGDVSKIAQLQSFAWQAEGRGKDVHLQANPTQAELLYKEYQAKKGQVAETQKKSILEKYGGAEHLDAPPKELLLAETEHYVEYSETGRLIKGQEQAKQKSKYEEDIFPLNHTTIWGSWWKDGQWGYACCHAILRASYCGGKAAIEAAKASHEQLIQSSLSNTNTTAPPKKSLLEQYVQRASKEGPAMSKTDYSTKTRLGEGDALLDLNKLAQAREAEQKRKSMGVSELNGDQRDGKRKYNSFNGSGELTEEQLEAYRMERQRGEDPMANYIDEE